MSVTPCSDAKRLANQANARKSTGPRTPRGKAIAAANSLRHGLFARDLLLPGEDADELMTLKSAALGRLNPRDGMELELVERVIDACWKLRRLQRLERLAYGRECERQAAKESVDREGMGIGHREPIPAEAAWQAGSEAFHAKLDRLENQQRRLDNGLNRALRQLQQLRKEALDETPSEFALAALAAEQAQHEKRRNEATAAEELAKASQLSRAKAKRERRSALAKARREQQRQEEIEMREDALRFEAEFGAGADDEFEDDENESIDDDDESFEDEIDGLDEADADAVEAVDRHASISHVDELQNVRNGATEPRPDVEKRVGAARVNGGPSTPAEAA